MFAMSSKFYRVCLTIYQLLCLNVLFIVFSLPIVTIGAAFSATIQVKLNEHGVEVWRPFLSYFVKSFKKTLPLLIFNLFSVLFILNLSNVALEGSSFLHLIKLVFISFVISYNLNSYVMASILENKKIIELFRLTFIFTLGTFFKTCLFPLLTIGIVYYGITAMGYIILLFIASLPIAIYLFLLKKDLRNLEKNIQLEKAGLVEVNEGALK